ncbi:NAD(P)-binding domain-containing protein [Cytobacillus kochii]|uniref:NAD(P)-binding domain-containing protein n=1 Tax=Cytobacillus kochii TaxID=859143 RepID=UPI002E231F78|nr:NAD(P)-binding domain-containing protein [Cytobacillus kochii]
MSLESLHERVQMDLSYLNINYTDTWVPQTKHIKNHVYDVVIVGGGQSGLGAGFALLREKITNFLIIDENHEGYEGPWETYARMVTLRTPKHITSIDLGLPSLTFRAWWEAQTGKNGWDQVDKIPRQDWMNYLRWYRKVLRLPVINDVKLQLIEPLEGGLHRLHINQTEEPAAPLLARKVILATGIQGGGEWHIPSLVSENLPKNFYAHTSKNIDFNSLKNKKIAILGGGASAFDNANYALSSGVAEAHIFVRRKEMPRINPIRQMEASGMIERYHSLSDVDKYTVMTHFFQNNQPPTNDTYNRASAWPGFNLHLDSPWQEVSQANNQVVVTTPHGSFSFDYLIISTGLFTDPALRPELKLVEKYIARWEDKYHPPKNSASPVLDAHPYLSTGYSFTSRDKEGEKYLHGLYTFNYSALISCGITAAALSGMKFGLPRLAKAIADELFQDHKEQILQDYFDYQVTEFTGTWPINPQTRQSNTISAIEN